MNTKLRQPILAGPTPARQEDRMTRCIQRMWVAAGYSCRLDPSVHRRRSASVIGPDHGFAWLSLSAGDYHGHRAREGIGQQYAMLVPALGAVRYRSCHGLLGITTTAQRP